MEENIPQARSSFEDAVSLYGDRILAAAYALLPRSEAEDVWQEVFLASLKQWPPPEQTRLGPWLFGILRHKVSDSFRARGSQPFPMDTQDLEAPLQSQATSLPHPHERRLDAQELYEALRTLPQRQREAVVYRHLVGLSYEEIAQTLGHSLDASRKAVSEGINKLRHIYQIPSSDLQKGHRHA